MQINEIIQKRSDLINFFLKEANVYDKEDVLNKEFAVLSFSPTEEYIDTLKSPFDHLCVDLSTYVMVDVDEVYVKGVIIDIDRQSFQTIIHLQNKDTIISITCKDAALSKYSDYFIVGEPIIAKCRVWNERMNLSFLVQLNNLDAFKKECSYMNGSTKKELEQMMEGKENERTHYGLIIECSMVKTKKGNDMLRGVMFDGKINRQFGVVKNFYNPSIPTYALAGDIISFNKPKLEFLLSNVEVVQ